MENEIRLLSSEKKKEILDGITFCITGDHLLISIIQKDQTLTHKYPKDKIDDLIIGILNIRKQWK